MGACCVSSSKQVEINNKPTNDIRNTPQTSKLDRCFISKTFNFDNQNLGDLEFLSDYINQKLKNQIKKHLEINVFSAENNQLNGLPKQFMDSLLGIKKMCFASNKFKSIPMSSFNLNSLKILDFSSNQITSLPSEVGNLLSLTELKLSHNQLNTIPTTICLLSNLQLVDLSHNLFTQFTIELMNLKTHTLFINNNKIQDFQDNIANPMTNNNADQADSYLNNKNTNNPWKNNQKIFNLDLSYNCICKLPSELLKSTNISILNLRGNKISYYELKKVDGYEDFLMRRKRVKDQGFSNNLDIDFDVCGLEI